MTATTADPTDHAAAASTPWLGMARLVIGLAQGAALYLLYLATDGHTWPATDPNLFAPLLMVAIFVPLIVIQALGNMRLVTLIAWTVIATGALAALAWFDVWQAWPQDWDYRVDVATPHVAPSATLVGFAMLALFIAQALITGADEARRFRAPHTIHFDVAWKLGVQIALSLAFVGVFWGLLWLGAELFDLINLNFLSKLLEHEWFAIPATTLALAAAIHVTDVRAGLVRGARTLVLTLLSWLVPVFALLVVGFLAALIFTGLQPLWDTHYAAGLLLFSATMLLLLINAAYQDGSDAHRPARALRYASSIAACALLPVVAIAAYAIYLRVQQYGWSNDRVLSAAAAGLLGFYAVGYFGAALLPGRWLKFTEAWNFYAAILVLAALVALLSPLASPARIAVDSQISRLQSGAVDPEYFDFAYLRFQGGRYGRDALLALKAHATGPKAAYIQTQAGSMLTANYPGATAARTGPYTIDPRNITVHPAGQTLPASFLKQIWNTGEEDWKFPNCLQSASRCDAVLTDLDGDGKNEILIVENARIVAFKVGDGDRWFRVGDLAPTTYCQQFLEALRTGNFALAAPPPAPFRDIVVMGRHFKISGDDPAVPCPD